MTVHSQNSTEKMEFKEFLKEIRLKAQNPRQLGELFEKTIKDFLKQSLLGQRLFS